MSFENKTPCATCLSVNAPKVTSKHLDSVLEMLDKIHDGTVDLDTLATKTSLPKDALYGYIDDICYTCEQILAELVYIK